MTFRRFARKRHNPEEKLHTQIAQYLNWALPTDSYWTTIPTVGSSRWQGAKLKMKGYRKGTPDLIICWRGRAFWLEIKAPGGQVAAEQIDAWRSLRAAGCLATLVYSIDHVEQWLTQWGIPLRARLAGEPAAVKAARGVA